MSSVHAQIAEIMMKLQSGFRSHKTFNRSYREAQLRSLRRALVEQTPGIHEAISKDLSRTAFQTTAEIDSITKYIDYTLKHLKKWMSPKSRDLDFLLGPGKTYILPEPYGVALILGSWNFPFVTTISPLVAAISAGNAALIKPSELAPHSSKLMVQILSSLDPECYQTIEGGPEIAKAVTDMRFDVIAFTGSPEKGKLVAAAASKYLTPTILELGGKNPAYIDDSANLAVTARRIVQARYFNCGQICVAVDYVLISEKNAAKFLDETKRAIQDFFGPDPQKSPDLGRILLPSHAQRIKNLLDNHGGELICGGRCDVESRYVDPTIIFNPNFDAPISKEEIFGPVLLVYSVRDVNQAISFINSREKPLALYYYGANNKNKEWLLRETSSGAFCVNESVFHCSIVQLPFGGVGNSGTGSYLGKEGFKNFSHIKPVYEKGTLDCYPYSLRYPPYTPQKISQFAFLKRVVCFTQNQISKALVATGAVTLGWVAYNLGYLDGVLNI
jgi:aldehyde dehydrogenase (NAD+)